MPPRPLHVDVLRNFRHVHKTCLFIVDERSQNVNHSSQVTAMTPDLLYQLGLFDGLATVALILSLLAIACLIKNRK